MRVLSGSQEGIYGWGEVGALASCRRRALPWRDQRRGAAAGGLLVPSSALPAPLPPPSHTPQANYLMGRLGLPAADTWATIDMGGGSMQARRRTLLLEAAAQLQLGCVLCGCLHAAARPASPAPPSHPSSPLPKCRRRLR